MVHVRNFSNHSFDILIVAIIVIKEKKPDLLIIDFDIYPKATSIKDT